MIESALYLEPIRLDPAQHRAKKVVELTDFSVAGRMHMAFITAIEFPQAALEFPIVFIPTGERDARGRPGVSPVVLLGLVAGENLHVDGSRWDARYIPAFIRRYPFFSAEIAGETSPAVFVDAAWSGFSDGDGEALFEAGDKPAPALARVLQFLERFDLEAQRTLEFCARVVELDLLKEMKADISLPGGGKLAVEGFLTIDDDRLLAIPDADVIELHRSGLLMLMQLHLLSLANVRLMAERKSKRLEREAAGA